jgi:hypothetical protein
MSSSAQGRLIAIPPERWMDSRNAGHFPVGAARPTPVVAGGIATALRAPSTAVPATGVSALVVNVTAAGSAASGYMVALPSGGNPAATQHSTVNFAPGAPSANTAIVPLGADGSVSVYTTATSHIILDVVGYITGAGAADTTTGLFQAVTPVRAYDTRHAALTAFGIDEARTITLGSVPGVAADAAAVSANLTVTGPTEIGYLTVFPTVQPATSNLNFGAGQTVANGALLGLSPSVTVVARMSQAGHLLIDINGFFLS